ncbi:hypothetical protein [Pseudolabrys sp.]|uniref:hypothetical protein n=1 Tax=Pseudolabrys sp. TaxID=1960880 RepID=UPI003D0CC39D
MNSTDPWAQAIEFERDEDGQLALASVLHHIRSAVVEAGFVSRGKITRGLKEAYGPFHLDESALTAKIKQSIDLLRLSGDIDEFHTSAGRGYAATPPRRVEWGGSEVAVLGATTIAASPVTVRRMAVSETEETLMNVQLDDELGRPDWRSALVELGGSDEPQGNAVTLFQHSQALAASGERYSLDEPERVAVVGGRGEFFGKSENAPSGRWKRIDGDGCFPAAIRTGFTTRLVVLAIAGNSATLWQPPSLDLWRWVVVGATLALDNPVLRYDRTTGALDFLTPPPRQVERAALLTGHQTSPWSWRIDDKAYETLAKIMGTTR